MVGESGVLWRTVVPSGFSSHQIRPKWGCDVAFSGFVGTYTPRMDDKGRITLPAKYRDKWAAGVVLMRGRDHTLYVLTPEGFETFAADAISAEITDDQQVGFQRYMLANTEDQQPDAQGRITVPAKMRAYAGLGRDVVLTGVGLRMEIWSADAWARYEAEQEAAYASPSRGLFGPG